MSSAITIPLIKSYLPLAALVGADAAEDALGFENGELSLNAFGGYADFFCESASGVFRIFAEQLYNFIAGFDLFLWLLYRSIFSD